jgi:hypothetical protein
VGKVLVEVETALWGRVRARALEEGVKVEVVVGRALRGELAGFHGTGSVVAETGQRQQPPAAERGVAMSTTDATAFETLATGNAGRHPTKDQLQALIDQVPAQRTVASSTAPVVVEDRRDAERRRVAAQDRLRTSPEDESQVAPDDKAGF